MPLTLALAVRDTVTGHRLPICWSVYTASYRFSGPVTTGRVTTRWCLECQSNQPHRPLSTRKFQWFDTWAFSRMLGLEGASALRARCAQAKAAALFRIGVQGGWPGLAS